MKKATIQHNWTSGFGDFVNCLFEYYYTIESLKKEGYQFDLYLFLENNLYIKPEFFFDFFNIDLFKNIFNKIQIIKTPYKEIENQTYFFTPHCTNPGIHCWDLFLEKPEESYRDLLKVFSYKYDSDVILLDIFNKELMNEYKNKKKEIGLNKEYASIYFRANDYEDNEIMYEKIEKEIKNILKENLIVFVNSNSYKFKEYVKKLANNIVMYSIPSEKEFGNTASRIFFEDTFILKERLKYLIFEMLTLSDSYSINYFTMVPRMSNFLMFSQIKNCDIKMKCLFL